MKTKPRPIDQGGLLAVMSTECRGCGKPIRKGRDYIYYERGWQIHVGCPGSDQS